MAEWILGCDEANQHQSAMVAPLNIQKSPTRSRALEHGHSRQSSSRGTQSTKSRSHMSPPLTPTTSNYAMAPTQPVQPVFHNYLRASHHYNPSSNVSSTTDETSITVAIKQGDVILVHSVHPNGWADGTLLASGARGWLPTNYCEAYDNPPIHSLLNALTHLWDLVRDGENGDLFAFTRQDYVRGMIAGIRFFLERTNCLSRESPLVISHIGLRRMRKGLLGDLSSLVKSAKKLQETLHRNDASNPIFDHLDELVLRSFKLVTRAVRFHDIWATDAVSLSLFDLGEATSQRPLTPPSDTLVHAVQPQTMTDHRSAGEVSTNHFEPSASSIAFNEREDDTAVTYQPPRNFHRLSVAFSLPSDVDSLQSPVFPPHSPCQPKRFSLTHRFSYTGKSQGGSTANLALERLRTAQDAFLGCIASFIGLHLQSRSSEELADITEQSVAACRQLLVVVEEVWERDSRGSKELQDARDNMYARLTELVRATKDMFVTSDADVEDDPLTPEARQQVVSAATNCVRSAGDCVAKARVVVEKIGDFEFEIVGLGLADSVFQQFPSVHQDDPEKSSQLHPFESIPEEEKPLPMPPSDDQSARSVCNADSKPLPDVPENSILQSDTTISPPNMHPTATNNTEGEEEATPSTSRIPEHLTLVPVVNPSTVSNALNNSIHVQQDDCISSPNTESINTSMTDSSSGYIYSSRSDARSLSSRISTRATTPEHSTSTDQSFQTLNSSFGSSSEVRSLASDDIAAGEEHLLETTFVHELIYNKEGQISGGSLPALVEQLTTHESTPDAVFVTTFYLTFRLFTTPTDLAQCLIDRFDYIGDSSTIGVPVRLRVYNVFKGWLESHWSSESDAATLDMILSFANDKLSVALPAAGKRLAELTTKVTEVRAGALVPRLVSSIGKTGVSNTVFTPADSNVPASIITKSQLNTLRANKEGKSQCSILDFDPLEMARQFTIIESRLFCSIQPEELLALEWTKKVDSKALNVKAMSTLSTDLANLVADTILHSEDPKKRATIIKQWVKIAMKCLELNNYDSLMAIICSLNSSMILRLKRTWELVSTKTKTRLEELKSVTDVGRNYAVLRQRLHNHIAPCIPFVGIYLTDLTFVDVGNGTTRQLPGESGRNGVSVINFDKHMKTAKIIGQLQSFQVPYRLAAIPEMQDWMETQIQRVRASDDANVQSYYRRSLVLEPRETQHPKGSPSMDNGSQGAFTAESRNNSREKFDFLNFNFSTSSFKPS